MDGRNLKNPYPGLRPFEQEDSDFFFGRETHTEELLRRRLSSSRFVAVVGTSGGGKSSLVRAGLIPALYSDLLAAGSHWRVAIFRPGNDPITAMADELHKNISVVVDGTDGKLPRDMLETTFTTQFPRISRIH
jgi:excinuclease UvrABC ATPase subunit